MGDVVDLRRIPDIEEELRRVSAGVSELVWPVILALPVGPSTIELITCLIDLWLAAERLASEGRFLGLRGA
jgi:hypothetical protein